MVLWARTEFGCERMTQRLPALLKSPNIEVLSASKKRTRASAEVFLDVLIPRPDPRRPEVGVDDEVLNFHKSNVRYRQYLSADTRLTAAIARARSEARIGDAAALLLGVLVAPRFIDELGRGQHRDLSVDHVDAAQSLYAIWQVLAGATSADAPPGLSRYLPSSALRWFGYLDDVETFYKKGPAFAGDDVTFGMARTLLADMIASANARFRDSSATVARLRFTHAEEILPLATLLQIPPAHRPVAENETYTYESNPFRGAHLAPMAANIQWEIYSNGNTSLVRMLVNEVPTGFAAPLRPVDTRGELYRLDEIEQQYGRRA
jgi:hypothetical protein